MDINQKWVYFYRRYFKFILYNLWEWVSKNISINKWSDDEITYFERYENLENTKKVLTDCFEKTSKDLGYNSTDEWLNSMDLRTRRKRWTFKTE